MLKDFRAALRILLVALFLGGCTTFLIAQECDRLCHTRSTIKKLEKYQADPNIATNLKAINARQLHDSRIELRLLLQQNLDIAKDLLSGADTSQKQALNKTIAELETEWKALQASIEQESAVLSQNPQPASASIGMPPTTEKLPSAPKVISDSSSPETHKELKSPEAKVTKPSTWPAGVLVTGKAKGCSDPGQESKGPLFVTAKGWARLIMENQRIDAGAGQFSETFFAGVAEALIPEGYKSYSATINSIYVRSETRKDDKQIGASSGASGTTTIAEKSDFAKILGFAIEHGAIDQAVNGTSLTLSSSPYALFTAGKGGDTPENYEKYGSLARLGAAASFNISDQNAVLASVQRKQLSEWSVRYRFSPDRSTRSQDFQQILERLGLRSRLNASALAFSKGLEALSPNGENDGLMNAISDKLFDDRNGPIKKFMDTHHSVTPEEKSAYVEGLTQEIMCFIRDEVAQNIKLLHVDQSALDAALRSMGEAELELSNAKTDAEGEAKKLEKRWQSTLTYSMKRQEMASDYSTVKFIYERSPENAFKITANAGASFYHRPDPLKKQESFRDFSAALAFEAKLGRSPFVIQADDQSPVVLVFTGMYERMPENRGVPMKKADIGIAQFKVSFPVATGVALPISFTYANATELIKEKHVRANFGFTFDLDKLTSVLSTREKQAPK